MALQVASNSNDDDDGVNGNGSNTLKYINTPRPHRKSIYLKHYTTF